MSASRYVFVILFIKSRRSEDERGVKLNSMSRCGAAAQVPPPTAPTKDRTMNAKENRFHFVQLRAAVAQRSYAFVLQLTRQVRVLGWCYSNIEIKLPMWVLRGEKRRAMGLTVFFPHLKAMSG